MSGLETFTRNSVMRQICYKADMSLYLFIYWQFYWLVKVE